MSGKRDRTNELKVFLSDNEQYVLDEKVKTSHMRNKSEYIRHMILLPIRVMLPDYRNYMYL